MTPKISKTANSHQKQAQNSQKQDHIPTKTFIFSRILEKNEHFTIFTENGLKQQEIIKNRSKTLKMRQSRPIVGQNPSKINKIQQI